MADEEKKEGISARLFGKKKEKPESEPEVEEEVKTMEEPTDEVKTMEEPPPPAPTKKAKAAPAPFVPPSTTSGGKLAGHPVARKKHRDILSQRKNEARKYLITK